MTASLPPDDAADLAADYAAGSLNADERRRFEHRLDAGDAALSRELAQLGSTIRAMVHVLPPVAPSPEVKQRLLDKVIASKDPEVFLQRAADAEWIDTEFPGIQVRVLFVDRKRNLQTLILRAGPGVSFPDHLHLGPEEGLLLEGDLSSGGHLLTAGDYIRFKEGSRHGPSRTETGCMLLTMSVIDPIQT